MKDNEDKLLKEIKGLKESIEKLKNCDGCKNKD